MVDRKIWIDRIQVPRIETNKNWMQVCLLQKKVEDLELKQAAPSNAVNNVLLACLLRFEATAALAATVAAGSLALICCVAILTEILAAACNAFVSGRPGLSLLIFAFLVLAAFLIPIVDDNDGPLVEDRC